MKIVVVSAFYSEGMGYTENCLPRALAALGHDVHVVASTLNVYGNTAQYAATYEAFLGPAVQPAGVHRSGDVTVHRLPFRYLRGYVWIKGLVARLRSLRPQIVHCTEIASLQSFTLAAARPMLGYQLFAETHQHMSVVKPFLKGPGRGVAKLGYRLTRTLPTRLACLAVNRVYAIAPDCIEVAKLYFGVPAGKLRMQSLGTDTLLFHPTVSPAEVAGRSSLRGKLGFADHDVVCIYTGRFSSDKNPLLLARAVGQLAASGMRVHSLFVGEGAQRAEIESCRNARIVPFAPHAKLAELYRCADIAVWPRQESMSMLDAAASGLPLVVSGSIGERSRVEGNGRFYLEDDVDDLAHQIVSLLPPAARQEAAVSGREKMEREFSWSNIAKSISADYEAAVAR